MSAAGLFGKAATDRFTYFATTLKFRNVVVGGVPSDENTIRSWIMARMDLDDQALAELIEETVRARGGEPLTPSEAIDVVAASDLAPSVNGFKRIFSDKPFEERMLAMEGRQITAAWREWTNSLYPYWADKGNPYGNWPGQKIARVRKSAKSHLAECLTVVEDLIPLGVTAPTRIEERIKHVQTPNGPRSAINRVEVVEHAEISFTVKLRDFPVWEAMIPEIWASGEEIGLGADRARMDGRFDLLKWDKIES